MTQFFVVHFTSTRSSYLFSHFFLLSIHASSLLSVSHLLLLLFLCILPFSYQSIHPSHPPIQDLSVHLPVCSNSHSSTHQTMICLSVIRSLHPALLSRGQSVGPSQCLPPPAARTGWQSTRSASCAGVCTVASGTRRGTCFSRGRSGPCQRSGQLVCNTPQHSPVTDAAPPRLVTCV